MLALAAVVYVGGRFVFSARGQYVMATLIGGGPDRVRPVLESALARAAQDLNLPPPYPLLVCEPDSGDAHLCSTAITLTPGVSTLQGNAQFTRRFLEMGLDFQEGTEHENGTVSLRYGARSRISVLLQLIPAQGTGMDTVVTPPGEAAPVNVRGRLALIVEDYGVRPELSRRFADLPGTFTAAIRPNQNNVEAWVKEARQSGMEVLLHLPMEPRNYPTQNPGEDAILVDLSGKEIRKRVKEALDKVGPVGGAKTYMGSLAVEDRDVVRPILEEFQKRNLFLIESTQSQYSAVPDLAREIGVPIFEVTSISEVDAGRRNAGTIGIRFNDLVRRVRAKGYALGLIHAKEGTLEVLEEQLPRLAREGIVVMGVSEIMKLHALE